MCKLLNDTNKPLRRVSSYRAKNPWMATVTTVTPAMTWVIEGRTVETSSKSCLSRDEMDRFRRNNPEVFELVKKKSWEEISLRKAKFRGEDYLVSEAFINVLGGLVVWLVSTDPKKNAKKKRRTIRASTEIELREKIEDYLKFEGQTAKRTLEIVNKNLRYLMPEFSCQVSDLVFEELR